MAEMTNLTHAWVWMEDGKPAWIFSRCYHDSIEEARACVRRRFDGDPTLLSEPFPDLSGLRPAKAFEQWEGYVKQAPWFKADAPSLERILIFRWTDEDEED